MNVPVYARIRGNCIAMHRLPPDFPFDKYLKGCTQHTILATIGIDFKLWMSIVVCVFVGGAIDLVVSRCVEPRRRPRAWPRATPPDRASAAPTALALQNRIALERTRHVAAARAWTVWAVDRAGCKGAQDGSVRARRLALGAVRLTGSRCREVANLPVPEDAVLPIEDDACDRHVHRSFLEVRCRRCHAA